MALEIEVKSRIDDHKSLRDTLDRRYPVTGEYTKYDSYYSFPDGKQYFRIRTQGDQQIVTMKKKVVRGGIEENEETEFTVSDREKFVRFILRAGCTKYIEKVKTSRVYRFDDLTVELSYIRDLGWFIEIEKLAEESLPEEEREAVRDRLLSFLDEIGVGRERIEGRYYIELLAEKAGM